MPKTTKKALKPHVKKQVKKQVSSLEKNIEDIEKKAVKATKKVASQATAVAKKNPWAVAGITAGLGVLVGILSTKKKPVAKKKKK